MIQTRLINYKTLNMVQSTKQFCLSININEADTTNTEAARRAQVYESKGLINVKYSFLSEGALLRKCMS